MKLSLAVAAVVACVLAVRPSGIDRSLFPKRPREVGLTCGMVHALLCLFGVCGAISVTISCLGIFRTQYDQHTIYELRNYYSSVLTSYQSPGPHIAARTRDHRA